MLSDAWKINNYATASLLYFGVKPMSKKDAEVRRETTKDFNDIEKGLYNFNTMPFKYI